MPNKHGYKSSEEVSNQNTVSKVVMRCKSRNVEPEPRGLKRPENHTLAPYLTIGDPDLNTLNVI